MSGFMQWNGDQGQVFNPWASLHTHSPKSHAVRELSGDAQARLSSATANARAIEAYSYNQAPGGHPSSTTDLHAEKENILPRFRDNLTGASPNTESRSPGMPSHSHNCYTELQEQNAELKGALNSQLQQIGELRLQVSSLQREVVTTTASYEQLLARVMASHNSITRPLSFQPFFRILKFARAANSNLPTYQRENYIGQFYWTEESFEKERQRLSGLTVLRDEHSGPLSFLVGEDGVVVSTRRQQQFLRFGRVLYNTLLRYEMAPGHWHDIDVYALEWFCLAIRVEYVEFRLCDDHWKAEAFGAVHYAKWCQPTRAALRSSFSQSETVRAQDAQETETNTSSRTEEVQLARRILDSNLEVRERKEVAVQVTRPLGDFASPETAEGTPVGAVVDHWKGNGNTSLVSDFPLVLEEKGDVDDSARLAVSPSSASSWFSFAVNQPHPVHDHAEDPPDFFELRAQEQSRVVATSKLVKEKRQRFDALKKETTYKAKPRGKEKKQYHVQTRRALDDAISSCLADFERDKARQNNAKRRVAANKCQAERRLQQATSSLEMHEHREQKAWEQRPEIRQRLDSLVKYVDHVERAYRKEERVILTHQFSEELAASSTGSSTKSDPRAKRLRLSRMLPDFDSYHAVVMGQRVKEFRKKKAEAAQKIKEEKEARVREKRKHEAWERSAQMEAVLRQRRAAKSWNAQEQQSTKQQRETERKPEHGSGTIPSKAVERLSGAESTAPKPRPGMSAKPRIQQKWERTSVPDTQPISTNEWYETGGASRKSSQGVLEPPPKYRPSMFGGRPQLPVPAQPAEKADTQAEARTKAQTEFQARMKARLEAQANAAAKRRQELEQVALEDTGKKGLRMEAKQSSSSSILTVKNEIPGEVVSTVPGAGPRHTPGASSPSTLLPTPDPVTHKRVNGWRLSTTMPREGAPVEHSGTQGLVRDAGAAFTHFERSPRIPVPTTSLRVGIQPPTGKLVGNTTNPTWQPGTDDPWTDRFPSASRAWRRGLQVNPPVPQPIMVKDTREAAPGQESRSKRLTPSHEVWRPGKRQ
ncbi:hypothetical protein EDC04DRAFT_286969 [Pisolithus marmoratus]|nr:hypothetical protein EDC04DRAFT_286969 [Pisolithus marmoratus]